MGATKQEPLEEVDRRGAEPGGECVICGDPCSKGSNLCSFHRNVKYED